MLDFSKIDQTKGVTHAKCGAHLGEFYGSTCPNCKQSIKQEDLKETGSE